MGERTASPIASGGPSSNGGNGADIEGKAYIGLKPEELEEAKAEMLRYVMEMMQRGLNYFGFLRRIMYGEGFTLPFSTETRVGEGGDGVVFEATVRVYIPYSVLPKYIDLKRRKLIGEIFR